MRRSVLAALGCAALLTGAATAGDFKAAYFTSTPEGAWSQYALTARDGTAATYTYARQPDADGRVVLELGVKTTAGAAAGSESTMRYTLSREFDFVRDGLSYGKFIQEMVMKYGEMEMPVDTDTLEVIRNAEKDFRGAVAFVGPETVGGLACSVYTYAMDGVATRETGTLWMNASVPFAVVKQTGKVVNPDGTVASEFELTLQEHGRLETAASTPAPEPEPAAPAAVAPVSTTLVEGFQAGQIGLDVQALAGGKQLRINFRNEIDAPLIIDLAAGPVDLAADFPVHTLRIQIPKGQRIELEPGASSDPVVVSQRGTDGITEGKCYLSIYEGSPIFQGSVTMDQLPK
jgi:hypothetical protein